MRTLISNILWAGSDGSHDTRARVFWDTIIQLGSEGGLPDIHIKALLGKLVVRGLVPGGHTFWGANGRGLSVW